MEIRATGGAPYYTWWAPADLGLPLVAAFKGGNVSRFEATGTTAASPEFRKQWLNDVVTGAASAVCPVELAPVRTVTARAGFKGPPGMEREAAEAWAFELTYYFLRGVGEAPQVVYENGVYTCTGLMDTTHPWDTEPVTNFGDWDLAYCLNEDRRFLIRKLYPERNPKYDGRPGADVAKVSTRPVDC